jgi:DNA-binding transcriptional ArsR family regulator
MLPPDGGPLAGPLADELVIAVFAALGDPTRRTILEQLGLGEDVTASGLADRLPVSRQAIAKHLGILERAGLVVAQRDGRDVRYAVEGRRLEEASRWMTERATVWDRRLAAIKRLAESADHDT